MTNGWQVRHNAPKDSHFKLYVAGMKRGLTKNIKGFFKRRAAVEPVIGHTKNEHHMGRNLSCPCLRRRQQRRPRRSGLQLLTPAQLAEDFVRLHTGLLHRSLRPSKPLSFGLK
jgi:hypothetical protein